MNDLARRLLALLETRRGEFSPSNPEIDKYQHSLQCATRAARAGEPADYVVMCLFHDVFGGFSALHHGVMAGMVLAPYVSLRTINCCTIHVGAMAEIRTGEVIVDHNKVELTRAYPEAKAFALLYDMPSFDPNYPTAVVREFYGAIEAVMPDEHSNAFTSGVIQ